MRAENLIGKKFGKLTVVSRGKNSKGGKAMWICKCDCGKIKEKPVSTYDLKKGKVKSCGCLYFESNKGRNKTHGMSKTRLYKVWASMMERCYNQNQNEYCNYGGRGIRVCDEWKNNFVEFYKWAIKNGYDKDAKQGRCTIDRINCNGNYEPNNCQFVDMIKQNNNRRNNRLIRINGMTKTARGWSDISGISPSTIRWRVTNGWNESELLIEANLGNKIYRRNMQ